MTYQVLARRWRPQSFEQIVGQEHVLRALVNALERDRLHHAYLLTGTRGVGKTTLARLLAKCLNCERGISARPCGECGACREIAEGRFMDLLEVDAASRTKVEDTRELLDNVQYAPARGRFKVYLIDEVHMLSPHSFNALLKTLEEPPPHVKFLLATTDPQKLPATILSRCLQLHLRNLVPEQIKEHLGRVLTSEGIAFEEPALWELALAADGSMRDALSLTDQAIAHGAGTVAQQDVADMLGHVNREQLHAVMGALLAGEGERLLEAVEGLVAVGADCERALAELLVLLHHVALVQAVPAAQHGLHRDRDRIAAWAGVAAAADVQLYYQIGLQARRDFQYAPDARGGLEMALLRMIAFRPAGAPRPSPPDPAGSAAAKEVAPAPIKKPEPAPAAHTAAAPAAPVGAPPAVRSVADITATNWAALLDELALGGVARSLAANALPERVEGQVVHLVLQEEQTALRAASAEERLAEALSRHFGAVVALRIRTGQPAAETPAARDVRAADERRRIAAAEIEHDANVRLLVQTFGGKVHAETIRAVSGEAQRPAREEGNE